MRSVLLIISLSLGLLANGAQAQCSDRLVNFWQSFAARHGSSAIPAFLIELGCMQGPLINVDAYYKQQALLSGDYQPWLDNYYLDYSSGTGIDPVYQKQISLAALKTEQTAGASNTTADQESSSVSQTTLQLSASPDDHHDITAITAAQPETASEQALLWLQIKHYDISANRLLLAIIAIILLVLWVKRRKPVKTGNKPQASIQCADCGSSIKADRQQCFICGAMRPQSLDAH